jgi:hypothetical protein
MVLQLIAGAFGNTLATLITRSQKHCAWAIN